MAQEQNYQVNYSINVDASQGTKQVIAFGEAVGKLVQAKASLTPAVTNIKNMMDEIDRVFRTKNGKKRNFDYRLTIDTKKSEEKLERIKGLLTDISTLSKGISLTINAGQALDSKKIKANAKSLYEKKAAASVVTFFICKILICGEWGIRTPGTVIPYVSLANWWFQPLTQLSKPSFFSKSGANIGQFCGLPK